MKKNELFKKYIQEEIIEYSHIPQGLTNENYWIKTNHHEYVIRIPNPSVSGHFDYQNEGHILKLLEPLNITPPLIFFNEETGVKITPFISASNTYSSSYLKRATHLIKALHTAKIQTGITFNILDLYLSFTEGVKGNMDHLKYLTKTQEIIDSSDTFLCHNDLVAGNFLFTTTHEYLIDFEYASNNHPYFDLMSFITENDIMDHEQRNLIYGIYFDHTLSPEEVSLLTRFEISHHMLWIQWAKYMYANTNNSIYQSIQELKEKRLRPLYEIE